ncbi:hypothetical protein GC194_04925 [bacterium]|nr:hypothetical protein [bacterium]
MEMTCNVPNETPDLYPELRANIENEIIRTQNDLNRDYAEIILDQTFQEDIVKEIPWVKTIYSAVKIGLNLRDRALIKKISVFIQNFNAGDVTDQEREEFLQNLNADPKFKQKVFDYTLQLNDRFLQVQKAAILGRLFANYVKQNIDWRKYQLLSETLDTQTLHSLNLLHELSQNDFIMKDKDVIEGNRTEDFMSVNNLFWEEGYVQGSIYASAIGRELWEYGIKEIDLAE